MTRWNKGCIAALFMAGLIMFFPVKASAAHVHTDSCYNIQRPCVCENTDKDHKHNSTCYLTVMTLKCKFVENAVDTEAINARHRAALTVLDYDFDDEDELEASGTRTGTQAAAGGGGINSSSQGSTVTGEETSDGTGSSAIGSGSYDAEAAGGYNYSETGEGEGHTHTDECYTETRKLICGKEDDPDHIHTEECYETVKELTCGYETVKHIDQSTETESVEAGTETGSTEGTTLNDPNDAFKEMLKKLWEENSTRILVGGGILLVFFLLCGVYIYKKKHE